MSLLSWQVRFISKPRSIKRPQRRLVDLTRIVSSRTTTAARPRKLDLRRIVIGIGIVSLTAPATGAMHQPEVSGFTSLPLAFERNDGQVDASVRYLARAAGVDVFFLETRTRIVKRDSAGVSAVDLRFVGARSASPIGLNRIAQQTHYLRGPGRNDTTLDVANYERLRYAGVYPGIDVVYYGAGEGLEFDFVVGPYADADRIRLAFDGARKIAIEDNGALVAHTASGSVTFRSPVAYQHIGGEHRTVAAKFEITSQRHVRFRLGRYDRSRPLIIDPILTLSTNLWGNVAGVALDAARNIYVAGSIYSAGLPATNGYQTQLAGTQDAYVLKLNPAGTSVLYATYLGARRVATSALAIAVDQAGSAYISGTTASGYPTTPGAYLGAGTTYVTKLNPGGNALAYSTYVTSPVASLAVDSAGNAYMTGTATALATTSGAFQRTKIGASAPYVAKLSPNGASILYATYLGGSANDEARRIAVDGAGNAYITGVARSPDFPLQAPLAAALSGSTDAFVAKLNASGSTLVYSTYLGGSGNERGFGIAVDAAGQAYVAGWTNSTNFPVTANAFQRSIGYPDPAVSNAFITKLAASGNSLAFSSYLGGKWCLAPGVFQCFGFFDVDEGIDVATSVAVDAADYVYVGGYVTSTLFPLVDSVQAVSPPDADVWHVPLVARIAPDGGRVVYASVVGTKVQNGGVNQIAVDNLGGVVAAGNVPAEYFPLTAGGVLGAGNGFLFKLDSGTVPTTVTSSSNPISFTQSVTLTATTLNPSPSAVVMFKDGEAVIGSTPVANGRATLTVTLAPGVHPITATNDRDNQPSPPHYQLVTGQ